ncbi:MAG: hypothetical protein H6868_09500 [Rhodospirillales bacterium]|nr:hypothetical protein [Rhodospirillales bacterium]
MKTPLPKELTSYDFLKMFAVLLMIVDHVGAFYFPDQAWFRVAGRLCVPVWFFLIGYARSRDLGPRLWVGFLLLIVVKLFAGMALFPVNILGTIIVVRLLLDAVMKVALWHAFVFWGVGLLLLALVPVTGTFFEYGTLAVILAMFGYLLRHSEQRQAYIYPYIIFCVAAFMVAQLMYFDFSTSEFIVLFAGTILVMVTLYHFKPVSFSRLTMVLPGFVVSVIQFFGRRTLEIYVVHLALIMLSMLWLAPDYYRILGWKWFY